MKIVIDPKHVQDSASCPRAELHTSCPSGYIAWHGWADEMVKTHRAQRCPGCHLWRVWVSKKTKEPVP